MKNKRGNKMIASSQLIGDGEVVNNKTKILEDDELSNNCPIRKSGLLINSFNNSKQSEVNLR